ncbi:MAG TPA: GGDEF domain-containing protein, partial [Albitalea sp.]
MTSVGIPPQGAAPHAAPTPAQLAKAALKRLVEARLEPTPENYARAYQQESGAAAPERAPQPTGEQLAELIGRIVQGVERRSRQWTPGRKKDSLQRVLESSRGDASRLHQRLRQLVASWDGDTPDGEGGVETAPAPLEEPSRPAPLDAAEVPAPAVPHAGRDWTRVVATL